jgi:plasmid stabilization system protein ParE
MAYRIFWTPISVQDLRDICDFISRDNLVAAQRMGEELIKESEAMAAFPMSGRIVPEKKDPLIREPSSVRTRVWLSIESWPARWQRVES